MAEVNIIEGGNLAVLTTNIVSAYVGANPIDLETLPVLIGSVHDSLVAITTEKGSIRNSSGRSTSIMDSITPDFLISFENGQRYKSLKRHLTSRGLTPAEYRARWGLAPDYPMVAPTYARLRSELAKQMGLGRKAAG